MKQLFTLIFLGVMMASCAFHQGAATGSASLSNANFSYVQTNVAGKAAVTYIFGFGGLAQDNLVADAKEALVAAYPLQANEALANLTVNFKTSMVLGIWRKTTCTVTADVVRFQ